MKHYEMTHHTGPSFAAVYDYYPMLTRSGNPATAGLQRSGNPDSSGLMPERYRQDTASHCMINTQTMLVPITITAAGPVSGPLAPVLTGTGVLTAAGDVLVTGSSPGDGVSVSTPVTPGVTVTLELEVSQLSGASFAALVKEPAGAQDRVLGGATLSASGMYKVTVTPGGSELKVVFTSSGAGSVTVKPWQWTRSSLIPKAVPVLVCNETEDYRFGFNGQEKVNEIRGIGNTLEFKYRGYDARIARFYAVDPLTAAYPWYTPYQFAGNTPIQAKDLEGAEPDFVIRKMEKQGLKTSEQRAVWDSPWGSALIYLSGNREVAEKIAINSGLPGLHNGPADALRHGLFNALNTQVAGEKTASALGDAHEEDRPDQPEQEKIMDLHNNKVGRQLAKENPRASPPMLSNMLIDKIAKGEMLMLDNKGMAVPTAITPAIEAEVRENMRKIYADGEKRGTKYEGANK